MAAGNDNTFNLKSDPAVTGITSQTDVPNPGPWEAVVIDHVAGTRSGQLVVSIPDFQAFGISGNITASYASPFYGKTAGTDSQQLPDGVYTSGQTYGMWMVPPDIGSKVLVMFVNGSRDRGYWFACIYDTISHHMVPGLARDIAGPDKTLPGDGNVPVGNNSNLPVVEFSTAGAKAFDTDAITNMPRYIHEYQSSRLVIQGLDRDPIRGAISSSSLRESPSNVYGISTPGRRLGTGTGPVIARRGGHQFVMDDGAAGDSVNTEGTDQLIRLRTSGGHQILMNDTEHVLYIASDTGNQWIEFSSSGAINVYGAAGYNVRAQGPINLHSDSEIAMQAPYINVNATATSNLSGSSGQTGISLNTSGTIGIQSQGSTKIVSSGTMTVGGTMTSIGGTAGVKISGTGMVSIDGAVLKLNCGLPVSVNVATPAPTADLPDTIVQDKVWVSVPDAIKSVCSVVPAHEPWVGSDGKSRPAPVKPSGGGSGLLGLL